jgi:hypothetical protein
VIKDGDYLDHVWLVVSMAALSKNAGATFARYCDWLGYSLIREVRVVYGPQLLQRIHKEELWIWAQRFLSDEEYVHNARMVGGGLDNASRILTAQREQYLKIPLHTLWLNQSEQQCMCLQGLGNKLAFEARISALIHSEFYNSVNPSQKVCITLCPFCIVAIRATGQTICLVITLFVVLPVDAV